MYSNPKTKVEVTCGYCGRVMGREYYFMCHLCGETYCYIHSVHHRAHREKVVAATP